MFSNPRLWLILILLKHTSNPYIFFPSRTTKSCSSFPPQPWTLALPTSAWMNHGGTQTTTSTSPPAGPCVTATCLENGTASRVWPGTPCPPSASLRITAAHTLPSGSTAATHNPRRASSPCLCVPASTTTAASGMPVWTWRPAAEGTSYIACPDPLSASRFTVAVSEHYVWFANSHFLIQ